MYILAKPTFNDIVTTIGLMLIAILCLPILLAMSLFFKLAEWSER